MTRRPLFAAASVALILGFAPSALAQDPNSALPDGPGKAELIKGCTSCHDATTISGTPRTPDAWERVIGDMMTNGAELTGDEHAAVYAYLVKNFSTAPATPAAPAPSDPKAPDPKTPSGR
jgi:hypothetical protein